MIRGLALAMIFINHVPGNRYEVLTSKNFGFSDAAEAFVLLAGVSAALAFGKHFEARRWWAGIAGPWHRAWSLYMVHIVISVTVLGLVAAMLRFGEVPELISRDNFNRFVEDPVGVLIGLPLLLHQFGYVNILPLYVLLMLAAPLLIWAGQRRPGWLLIASITVWAVAGLTWQNLPNYPNRGGWFLNPFSWQLIFVLGILTGLALRGQRRFVPVKRGLIIAAALYASLAFLVKQVPPVDQGFYVVMKTLREAGVPFVLVDFNKGYLQLPRLLHVLSLAYLVSVSPHLRDLSASRLAWPFVVMGRQALPVFAVGTVLSFAARAALHYFDPTLTIVEDVVILGGLLALVALAWVKELSRAALGAPRPPIVIPDPHRPAPEPQRAAQI
ncbi:OpgC domain-containing protein [Falsigemmobacter faecalis]|uniref:OpgC domain-containing protein n=2 Tax=Falsigemmobacter faecalis TaxID=2488730 RepID=A0A3P3DSK5_9RHOB|nr:OpgC domain-containing protein [Falsigemmobacter faecalis]